MLDCGLSSLVSFSFTVAHVYYFSWIWIDKRPRGYSYMLDRFSFSSLTSLRMIRSLHSLQSTTGRIRSRKIFLPFILYLHLVSTMPHLSVLHLFAIFVVLVVLQYSIFCIEYPFR